MNILKQEWKANVKTTFFWSIGILLMLMISFYKMQGLSTMPGGIDAFIKNLPPLLQQFFKISEEANSALGIYRMIHMYLMIALALHAVLLGASIFAKEERDKTYEFLYVKGASRFKILSMKILCGIGVLFLLDIVCLFGVYVSIMVAGMEFHIVEMFPYIGAMFLAQLFFFSLALVISLLPGIKQRSSSIGCGIVLLMFLISMYVKIGNHMVWLDKLSIFHYVDASYIKGNTGFSFPWIIILLLSFLGFLLAQYLHESRDLL